ncbi:MAG: FMN reductase [Corynebacterium sp.]|nr:FMN reductase [Corynebacterium sp.]
MHKLVVITAGLSNPSSTRNLSDQLANATTAAITQRGEAVEVETIELRNLALDMAQAMVSAGGVTTPALANAQNLVAGADGIIAVTPVFTASYSGLFKMFFDLLDDQIFDGKPVLVGATAGTARHSLVLDHAIRPLFGYLRAVIVPTGVFAATEDFGGSLASELTERINRSATELATLMLTQGTTVAGLRQHASSTANDDAPITSFEELLRGHEG